MVKLILFLREIFPITEADWATCSLASWNKVRDKLFSYLAVWQESQAPSIFLTQDILGEASPKDIHNLSLVVLSLKHCKTF